MSEIDFSILNDEDIFYIGCNLPWLAKGKDFMKRGKSRHMCIGDSTRFMGSQLCSKEDIIELRKATIEEIEEFYTVFPEERDNIPNVEDIKELTINDLIEAGWKFTFIE